MKKVHFKKRAFTLVELLVSVGIFVAMTSLVVGKYGNFNQSVLLTDLAYDVALTIRLAQSYGTSVKASETGSSFQYAYGVHLDTTAGNNQQIVLFADSNSSFVGYDPADEIVSTYAIKRGAVISHYCTISGSCTTGTPGTLDVLFKRPDPNALICLNGTLCADTFVQIMLKSTDGSLRSVKVYNNGQISVQN